MCKFITQKIKIIVLKYYICPVATAIKRVTTGKINPHKLAKPAALFIFFIFTYRILFGIYF
jgi:hypothetical protein